jgi:type VI secretion system protein ImpJ
MYLGPHHFQAQNRYFEDSMHFATKSLWYEAYGFVGFELDHEALRNGMVSLKHARGVFADGLPFDLPECDLPPSPRGISELFPPTRDSLVAMLAIPRRKFDGQNCVLEPQTESATRFLGVAKTVCDDTTGHDEKEVRLGQKNLRILFDVEEETASGMELIPMARIRRDTKGHFVFDAAFIPPCLELTASETLLLLLRRLIDILEEKSTTLQRERSAQGTFQTGMSARDVSSFWFLHAINASLGPLRHLCFSKRGHPEELYREMARLAGALCTFGIDSHPRSLPAYDHRDLEKCFREVDEHIRRHLEIMIPSQTITIPLKETTKSFFEGELADSRTRGPSRWLLAIRAPMGEADLIQKVLAVIKVCSAKFVPELVKRALPGMGLTHVPVPPSQIAARVEWQYFSVNRAGPCWEHIQQTRQVGVYVPKDIPNPEMELLVIVDS